MTACRFCGAEAPEEAVRCPACGKRLAPVRAAAPVEPVHPVEFVAPAEPVDPAGCAHCGREPTTEVGLTANTGMIFAFRRRTVQGRYCRDCGTALFRSQMNHTLLAGWWGVISFFANFAAIVGNLKAWRALRATPKPAGEGTPIDPGNPLAGRAGVWVTAALVAAVGIGIAGGADSTADRFAGQCIAVEPAPNRIRRVSCDEEHTGKVVDVVKHPSDCPVGTDAPLQLQADKDKVLCVDRNQ
ncbi:MAG TPA: hypothetical protein VGO92_15455 [Acidimicrobiales bacterium]|nr:hypothetical protein [Acidimicrobiales bacterium]